MWKDAWFLSKQNLKDTKGYIALNFFITGVIVLVFILAFGIEKNGLPYKNIMLPTSTLVFFLLYGPYVTKRHHSSFARVKDDLSRKELSFFRTFSIDSRSMVYGRLLSSVLIGGGYVVFSLLLLYFGLKEHYQLTHTQIFGVLVLGIATSFSITIIQLYVELVYSYQVFYWFSVLLSTLTILSLTAIQMGYKQSLIPIATTFVDYITIFGCLILLLASLGLLYMIMKLIIRRVRLK
ncbi:hypothetical protein [Baia soyae]|uniref:Uncharacterized protein n=1 Tax=Baia soyae TaxID=1544746 RepID=A0A4R2RYU5_9BACL|nr:hypothetical protein [Baia soyae]TCP68793.1 hypothetical protein EDD57_11533 [Baia soyae]